MVFGFYLKSERPSKTAEDEEDVLCSVSSSGMSSL